MTASTRASTLSGLVASLQQLLDDRAKAHLGSRDSLIQPLYAMLSYHLGYADEQLRPCPPRTGKRLRSMLCFLSAAGAGGDPADALPAALAVELVHEFSLVHDDVQDGSPLRRHRPTVWALWGIPHAINVGDGLFALALRSLVDEGQARGAPADRLARASTVLTGTTQTLCEGQFLDLGCTRHPQRPLSLDRYLVMIERKTAALFSCAAELGGLLAGAPEPVLARLRDFGRALGTGFQMQDDVVGVWGERSATGKPAADVRLGKLGLPVAIAWSRAAREDRKRLKALYSRGRPLDEQEVRWALELFARLRVRPEAARLVGERFALAHRLLEGLPSAQGAAWLREFLTAMQPSPLPSTQPQGSAPGGFA